MERGRFGRREVGGREGGLEGGGFVGREGGVDALGIKPSYATTVK